MAHKKAAGSAKNLRDSNSKYRGVKLFGGQTATAGNIIIRQKGDKFQLGKNVYKGADFTIHAAIDGVVTFRKKNITKYNGRVYLKTVVDVLPAAEAVKKDVTKSVSAKTAKAETTAEKKPVAKKAAPKTAKVETTAEKKPAAKKAAPKTAKVETTAEKKPAAKKAAPKKKAE